MGFPTFKEVYSLPSGKRKFKADSPQQPGLKRSRLEVEEVEVTVEAPPKKLQLKKESEEDDVYPQVKEEKRPVSKQPSRKRKFKDDSSDQLWRKRRRLSVEREVEITQEAVQCEVEEGAQERCEEAVVEMTESKVDVPELSEVCIHMMEPHWEMKPISLESSVQKEVKWSAEPSSEQKDKSEEESQYRSVIATDEPRAGFTKASMSKKRTMECRKRVPDARSPKLQQIFDKKSPHRMEAVRNGFRRRPPRQRMKDDRAHPPQSCTDKTLRPR